MGGLCAAVFTLRNILAALPLSYAFFSTTWKLEDEWIIWPAAALLWVAGAVLRGWARLHCAYAQGRRKTLATSGPYAMVRNPLYIGNMCIIAAAGVASEMLWFVPCLLAWSFLVYSVTIKHEERRLSAKYGAVYDAYRSQVPRWVPRRLEFSPSTFPIGASVALSVLGMQVLGGGLVILPFVAKELIAP
jgi:protein-S-isoprenylcysteine O-methyltransferase Ste14